MSDLLVKLYELPDWRPAVEKMAGAGVRLHRPIAPEKHLLVTWVTEHFNERWASEVEMAFAAGHPITCFVAIDQATDALVGFACYEATFKGFFGPAGVAEAWRGKGIGTALLLRCLHGLLEQGHMYGIIGSSDATEFYEKTVGASEIAGSDPGPYGGRVAFDPPG